MSMQQQLQERVTRLRGQQGQAGQTARLARQPDVALQTDGPSPAVLRRQRLLLARRARRRYVAANDLGMLTGLAYSRQAENTGPGQDGLGMSGLGYSGQAENTVPGQANIQQQWARTLGPAPVIDTTTYPGLPRQPSGQAWHADVVRLPTWEHKAHTQVRTCAICSEQVQDGESVTGLPCLHTFHSACITPWFEQKDTCPCCRHSIRHNQIGSADPQHPENTETVESPRAFALGELWQARDLSAENDLQQEFNRLVAELGTLGGQ